jgi:hypothetical protein
MVSSDFSESPRLDLVRPIGTLVAPLRFPDYVNGRGANLKGRIEAVVILDIENRRLPPTGGGSILPLGLGCFRLWMVSKATTVRFGPPKIPPLVFPPLPWTRFRFSNLPGPVLPRPTDRRSNPRALTSPREISALFQGTSPFDSTQHQTIPRPDLPITSPVVRRLGRSVTHGPPKPT